MKRAHDDISALANGDAKTEASTGGLAGNGAEKTQNSASATGQSSAAAVPATTGGGGDRRKCPYLDTINRNVLDFDFEKVCNLLLLLFSDI